LAPVSSRPASAPGGGLAPAPIKLEINLFSLEGRLPPGEKARVYTFLEKALTEIQRRKGVGG
jgi:hypothetical protein